MSWLSASKGVLASPNRKKHNVPPEDALQRPWDDLQQPALSSQLDWPSQSLRRYVPREPRTRHRLSPTRPAPHHLLSPDAAVSGPPAPLPGAACLRGRATGKTGKRDTAPRQVSDAPTEWR